jgi:hypothetical protein
MAPYIPWLWIAGVLHLAIASSNFVAARMLDYKKNLAGASPIVREIFWVQNIYIEIVLAMFACVTFFFPGDLAGGSPLGRFLSGFLTAFWGLRLVIQVVFYDGQMRKEHPHIDKIFLAAQVYLTAVFALAAAGWWKP